MVLERLTRKQTTSRADNVWPDMWKHMSDAAKSKMKQKWAVQKPKLDHARQIRGIFFIEPDDEELKHTMKNARRKLEIPMPAAMPCVQHQQIAAGNLPHFRETQDQICLYCRCRRIYQNTIGRCAAQESRRSHLCKKGIHSLGHYNLVHKFRCLKHFKIPDAKAAVEEDWETLEKLTAWQLTKVRNRKKVFERSAAKSKSTAMNLSSPVPTSSSSAKSLIASKSPGILTATEKPESRMRRNSKYDAVSSSQARLQDAYLGGLMDTATEN